MDVRHTKEELQAWREASNRRICQLDEERAHSHYQACVSWLQINDADQLAIFDTLFTEGDKYPGTCSWALQHRFVSSWLRREKGHALLWVQGMAGSGKSVLTTQISNFQRKSRCFVVQHHCAPSHASSTQYDQILKSLIMQLLRRSGDLLAFIYADCVLSKKEPSASTLEKIVRMIFEHCLSGDPEGLEYCWVIVDGLDSCDSDTQTKVLRLFRHITSKTSTSPHATVKALVASRSTPVILRETRQDRTVSLTKEAESLHDAIKQYAAQRVWSLKLKFHFFQMGHDAVQSIALKIADKSDGKLAKVLLLEEETHLRLRY